MNLGTVNDHLAAWNTWLGRQTDSIRIFDAGITSTPPTAPWSTARTLALAGYQVLYSFLTTKTTANFTAVGGGSIDARVDAIAAYCAQINVDAAAAGGEIWLCFCHEVENEGVTSASWQSAGPRVYGRLKTGAPGVTTFNSYLGGFYRSQFSDSAGRPDLWWPGSTCDVLGVDYYNWRGASLAGTHWAANNSIRPETDLEMPPGVAAGTDLTWDAPPGTGINSWLNLADNYGVPLCFPEFGCAITNPAGAFVGATEVGVAGRAAYIQRFANQWRSDPRILTMCYFDVDDLDGRVNWRLSGGVIPADAGTAAAFNSLFAAPAGSSTKVMFIDDES